MQSYQSSFLFFFLLFFFKHPAQGPDGISLCNRRQEGLLCASFKETFVPHRSCLMVTNKNVKMNEMNEKMQLLYSTDVLSNCFI